jgi:hypothetical protein
MAPSNAVGSEAIELTGAPTMKIEITPEMIGAGLMFPWITILIATAAGQLSWPSTGQCA